jgi:hypothetical protein
MYHAFEHRRVVHHPIVEDGMGEGMAFGHTKILHSAFVRPVRHTHSQQDEASHESPVLLSGDTGCQLSW